MPGATCALINIECFRYAFSQRRAPMLIEHTVINPAFEPLDAFRVGDLHFFAIQTGTVPLHCNNHFLCHRCINPTATNLAFDHIGSHHGEV